MEMRFSLVKLQDSGAHGLRGHREPVLASYPCSTAQLGQHSRRKKNTDICRPTYGDTPPPPSATVRSDHHHRSSWADWCFLEMEGGSLVAQRSSNGVEYYYFGSEREYIICKSHFRLPDREWNFGKLHLPTGEKACIFCPILVIGFLSNGGLRITSIPHIFMATVILWGHALPRGACWLSIGHGSINRCAPCWCENRTSPLCVIHVTPQSIARRASQSDLLIQNGKIFWIG
jgi:hypothetical protein